ncbi:CAZyme family AA11 [Penicillium roqueforti]|nr:CAZyme family AA11 [Penicillium roqueforti]KAI3261739.1 CAZyme family AA11 [Penicillium roqueforti]KAI3279452.1 CAZyme family AA11 [Penicillium roqueforti]
MIFVKWHLLLQAFVFSPVYAHLEMISPQPYRPIEKELDNSPLAVDGSDFPCKLSPGDFLAPTEEATYWTGHDNTINLLGSITHGGGSCQVSLTSDREPTKSSEWKVIKSFEGGCPASVPGNLPGGAASDNSLQLHFAIPKGIAPGKYTLAWTWFNRIGNREMYMNCAPITVANASTSNSSDGMPKQSPAFPPMFIANVNGCITKENVDIRFPWPGSFVEYNGDSKNRPLEHEPVCIGHPTFGPIPITNPADTGTANSITESSHSTSCSCGCQGSKAHK